MIAESRAPFVKTDPTGRYVYVAPEGDDIRLSVVEVSSRENEPHEPHTVLLTPQDALLLGQYLLESSSWTPVLDVSGEETRWRPRK